jgi:hypothetical protein
MKTRRFRRWKDFTALEKIVKSTIIGYAALVGMGFAGFVWLAFHTEFYFMLLSPLLYFSAVIPLIWMLWNTP